MGVQPLLLLSFQTVNIYLRNAFFHFDNTQLLNSPNLELRFYTTKIHCEVISADPVCVICVSNSS